MLITRGKKILSKGEKSADQNLRQSTFRRNIMRKGKFENINTTGKLNGKKDGGRQRKTEEGRGRRRKAEKDGGRTSNRTTGAPSNF